MKKIKDSGLIMSIIGSLIVIMIQPLLNLLGNWIFSFSNKIFKSFNNSLYIHIGQERYDFDFLIMFSIFLILIIIVYETFSDLRRKTKDLIFESDKLVSLLQNPEENRPQKNAEELLKSSLKSNEQIKKISKKVVVSGIIFGIVILSESIFALATQMTIKDKIFLYNNTKAIVTPYIEKSELEIIDSKFHQIQSKEDYDNIFLLINQSLEKKNMKIQFIDNKIELNILNN